MSNLPEQNQRESSPGKWVAGIAGGTLLAGAGWIAYSSLAINHNMPLPAALDSDMYFYNDPESGLLYYYADRRGEGPPLVLIHSVNAAASSYEMKPLFEHYRGKRPVYALDLPGFGFSERSARDYSPELYTAAVRNFLQHVVGEPADVVALSLGSEFVTRATVEQPELMRTLVLISPTGFSARSQSSRSQRAGSSAQSDSLYRAFNVPVWSQALYDLLATRASIYYFLRKSFVGAADRGLAEYGYLSAHRPGAKHAPLAFISGKLFTSNVRDAVYSRVTCPVLVIYDEDPYSGFAALPDMLLAHSNWNAARISPTRGLPHFERLAAVTHVLGDFWQA